MGAALSKIRAKAVASNVLQFVFIGERGHSTLRIIAGELLVEENEIGEPPADFGCTFCKGFEVRL